MKKVFYIMLISVFTIQAYAASGDIYWDDGGYHKINQLWWTTTVFLDKNKINSPGTHLDLVQGGMALSLEAYHNSTITMYDGIVDNQISAYGSSTVSLAGGTVNWGLGASLNSTVNISDGRIKRSLHVRDNAIVNMSGGSVSWDLEAYDNSIIAMSGGNTGYDIVGSNNANITMTGGDTRSLRAFDDTIISMSGGTVRNYLQVYENGKIYLKGDDFEVTDLIGNTYNLSYGSKLSEYGSFVDVLNNDYYSGTIKGTLSDGSLLNNTFEIYNYGDYVGVADIIIIPEPTTISLLALGGILVGRKSRALN